MCRYRRTWRRLLAGLAAAVMVVGCAATSVTSFRGSTFEPAAWTICSPVGFGATVEMPGPCVKAETGLATVFAEGRVQAGYGYHLGAESTITLDLPYDFSVLKLKNKYGTRVDLAVIRDAIVGVTNGGSLGRDLALDGGPVPGREFVVELAAIDGLPPGHAILVRLYAYDDNIWMLTTMMPSHHLDAPDVRHFMDSFEVLD